MPSKPTLPKGWSEIHSKSRPGKVYYLNKATGQKTWKLNEVKDLAKGKRGGESSSKKSESRPIRKYSIGTDDGEITDGPDEVQVCNGI